MLNIHKLIHLSSKWDVIFDNRPSTLRNSVIYWFLRITFNAVLLVSLIAIVTTFSRELWLPFFEDIVNKKDYEALDALLIGIRVIAIFFFAISALIVWLAKGALKRNNYINQVEELLNEYKEVSNDEYNSNPNNYKTTE